MESNFDAKHHLESLEVVSKIKCMATHEWGIYPRKLSTEYKVNEYKMEAYLNYPIKMYCNDYV